MESLDNINGIVEQNQWNRSTKSMEQMGENNRFVRRNGHVRDRKAVKNMGADGARRCSARHI
jgi:hypothetical protein